MAWCSASCSHSCWQMQAGHEPNSTLPTWVFQQLVLRGIMSLTVELEHTYCCSKELLLPLLSLCAPVPWICPRGSQPSRANGEALGAHGEGRKSNMKNSVVQVEISLFIWRMPNPTPQISKHLPCCSKWILTWVDLSGRKWSHLPESINDSLWWMWLWLNSGTHKYLFFIWTCTLPEQLRQPLWGFVSFLQSSST